MRLTLTQLADTLALVLIGSLVAVGVGLAWTLPTSHPALSMIVVAVCALAGTAYVLNRRHESQQQQASAALQSANDELIARVAQQTSALRDANARLQSIVDSAVDAIIVIDAVGRIDSFTPGAERLFGYAANEIVGRNVTTLMPSPDRDEHDGYLSRYLSTGERHIVGIGREVSALRKDGTAFPVHLSVAEMTIDGTRYYTGIIRGGAARTDGARPAGRDGRGPGPRSQEPPGGRARRNPGDRQPSLRQRCPNRDGNHRAA